MPNTVRMIKTNRKHRKRKSLIGAQRKFGKINQVECEHISLDRNMRANGEKLFSIAMGIHM